MHTEVWAHHPNKLFISNRRPSSAGLNSCSHLASALLGPEKLFQRQTQRGSQASLAREEKPLPAALYLAIAPAWSADEISKVAQWRAQEGEAQADWEQAERLPGVQERDGKQEEGCAPKIAARAFNQAPGSRYRGLISCYAAAPHSQLIVMVVGRGNGSGGCKSKGLAT